MSHDGSGPASSIVLGVDCFVSAHRAVTFAAREAAVRGLPLRILLAADWPRLQPDMRPDPSMIAPPTDTDTWARAVLEHATAEALRASPGLAVETVFRLGPPAPALVAESASADLLVLADRGRGRLAGLLLGSVATDVITRAHCPVAVVGVEAALPNDSRPVAPVLAAVDGGPQSAAVLETAFAEAAVHGTTVLAVHAWQPAVFLGPAQSAIAEQLHRPTFESAVHARALARAERRHPGVRTTSRVVEQNPVDAIVDAAGDAQLVVMGSRGRGALTGALLGSVSRAVVRRAPCPVVVVPVHQLPDRPPAQTTRTAHRVDAAT